MLLWFPHKMLTHVIMRLNPSDSLRCCHACPPRTAHTGATWVSHPHPLLDTFYDFPCFAALCCKNAFKDPSLLAYRSPFNLRDALVRAKMKTPKTSPSSLPKITRCNDCQCKTCKFIAHNTTSYIVRELISVRCTSM